jgi:hypothetical protein
MRKRNATFILVIAFTLAFLLTPRGAPTAEAKSARPVGASSSPNPTSQSAYKTVKIKPEYTRWKKASGK